VRSSHVWALDAPRFDEQSPQSPRLGESELRYAEICWAGSRCRRCAQTASRASSWLMASTPAPVWVVCVVTTLTLGLIG
jgi:hypothetical protein